MNSNLAMPQLSSDFRKPTGELSDVRWQNLTARISQAFCMDESGLKGLRSNSVLKLVAALPYLAGCDEPERTALSHMGTFILAGHRATRDSFAHTFKDSADIKRRLEPISHFSSGDPEVIDWGMKLLMIAMIHDHIHDADEDRSAGKLNPVNSGHWDGPQLIEQLRQDMPVFTEDRFTKLMSLVEIQTFWAR